jgi:hypothetical protein
MNSRLIAGLVVAVPLLGCQRPESVFTEAEKAAVVAEIEAARDAYFHAATTLDADALAPFMDQEFIHLSNSDIAPVTVDMLREAWERLSHIEMDVTSDRVSVLSPNAGYTVRTASYVVYDTAGVAVESNEWAGTHIWVKTGEGWKVQAVHEGRPVQR